MIQMARADFTILLDLQDYFSDDRRHSKIYINQNCSKISDLEDKISELFGIKRFHLLSEGHFLPASEDIALLKNEENVRVKPNIPQSQSILLDDTYYDKNNGSYKRMNLSEETIPVRAKRRKTCFNNDHNGTVQEVVFPNVKEKYEKQCMNGDHSNDNSFELHTSTPNNTNSHSILNVSTETKSNVMEISSSESKMNRKKNKKSNKKLNNSICKVIKPEKSEHKELEQKETLLEESTSHISHLKNQDLSKKSSKTDDYSFNQPIPYKKAKLKSWSTSPLKSTNIVQIIKAPIDKIDIDLSRFVFVPNDDLPPLKPIDIEKNILAENLKEDFLIASQEYSEELQSVVNKSQSECNKEPMEVQECHEELTEADSQILPPIPSLKESTLQLVKDIEELKQIESLDSAKELVEQVNNCYKSRNFPNISYQTQPPNCVAEPKQFISQNCSPELKPKEFLNSFDSPEGNIQVESCLKNENTELRQSQNSIDKIKQKELLNLPDSSRVSDLSEAKTQNISELSEQPKMRKSAELTATTEKSREAIKWPCPEDNKIELSLGNVRELRCKSRERWRRKIESHTKNLLSSTSYRIDHSEKLSQVTQNSLSNNNSAKHEEEKTIGSLNASEDRITFNTNENSPENDVMKYTQFSSKDYIYINKNNMNNTGYIKNCEMKASSEDFKPFNEIAHQSTNDGNKKEDAIEYTENSLTEDTKENIKITNDINNIKNDLSSKNFTTTDEIVSGAMISCETIAGVEKCTENWFTQDIKLNNKKMKNSDDANNVGKNISCENFSTTSEISLDSTMSHETTADDSAFLNPRRRRKRYRKKTKIEKASPRQERINVFPPQWVDFVPGKPKIHIRFNSSDDDISQEVNENVMDHSATSTEKIKILQDITINSDRKLPAEDMECKVDVESFPQDELLTDRYAENSEYCEPSEYPNDGNDIQMLLQRKKEELLRTVDSFTWSH